MAQSVASAPAPSLQQRHEPAPDKPQDRRAPPRHTYGALDLGTNNCRLLIARPVDGGFTVVDAFSRIVRLGEGLSRTGRLSDEAMDRAVGALSVCGDKLRQRQDRMNTQAIGNVREHASVPPQSLAVVPSRYGVPPPTPRLRWELAGLGLACTCAVHDWA